MPDEANKINHLINGLKVDPCLFDMDQVEHLTQKLLMN